MKRWSSAEAPVAAVARLADKTAAEVRPMTMLRRLGCAGETRDLEQSSQQFMRGFSPKFLSPPSFVAVRQNQKDQHGEDHHREAEGRLLAVPAPRLPHGEIFTGNHQKAEEPDAETDRQTGDRPSF